MNRTRHIALMTLQTGWLLFTRVFPLVALYKSGIAWFWTHKLYLVTQPCLTGTKRHCRIRLKKLTKNKFQQHKLGIQNYFKHPITPWKVCSCLSFFLSAKTRIQHNPPKKTWFGGESFIPSVRKSCWKLWKLLWLFFPLRYETRPNHMGPNNA